MNDIPHSALGVTQRANERALEEYRAKQAENLTQQRHKEILQAQTNLVESNNRVADEVHGIRDSLQVQIDDNRKEIADAKLTEEKHDKRSKHEFRLSFGVAIFSAVIALAALIVAIFK